MILKITFFYILFSTIYLFGMHGELPANGNIVVLGVAESAAKTKKIKREIEKEFSCDKGDNSLCAQEEITPKIMKVAGKRVIYVGPFENKSSLASHFFRLRQIFPSAVVLPFAENVAKSTKVRKDSFEKEAHKADDLSLWLALYALALIGVLALFASSYRIKKIVQENKKMRDKQKEMERRQHELFSALGENIYNMSQDLITDTKNAISEISEDKEINEKLQSVVLTEGRILDTSNNLLEFLKIKARKVEVNKKIFKINNLLDDVVGAFNGSCPHKNVELVLDIDHKLPINAIGDFTNIGSVLRNLIEHQFSLINEGVLLLSVSIYENYKGATEFQCKLTPYGDIEDDEVREEEYFVPHYDSESGTYRRLGLYVAYELCSLMGGELQSQSVAGGGTLISLSIPISCIKEERRKYRLPSKKYTQKEVYIVNEHYHASLAQKNLFSYFRHKVKVDSAENFKNNKPNLSNYDIVLIEDKLLYPAFENYSTLLREKYGVKVVGMRNILGKEGGAVSEEIFSRHVKKPLNQEHVFLLIKALYADEIAMESGRENRTGKRRRFIENMDEPANTTIDNLVDFADTRVLVVEDNEINLKMVSTVLERANIEVCSAKNGVEAIEKIKEEGAEAFDMVLMDINMPMMDGFTATMKIRQMPGSQKLPIVSLTALVLDHEIEKMKDAGMDGFLPKPINVGKLYKAFEIFVGCRKSAQKEPAQNRRSGFGEIEGVDTDVGLSHCNANQIFYKELLKEFLDVYGESGMVAQRLYEQKRFEPLKQLSLDVMGLAGTIGAKELYRAANEIYKLYLYDKLSLLPKYIDEYQAQMEKVKRGIEEYFEKYGTN